MCMPAVQVYEGACVDLRPRHGRVYVWLAERSQAHIEHATDRQDPAITRTGQAHKKTA